MTALLPPGVRQRAWIAVLLLLLVPAACADSPSGPEARPSSPGGPALVEAPSTQDGLTAFEDGCASCHASGDGFDLAFFSFPDSTVIRRAVHHVDSATADEIVTHLATFEPVDTVTRTTRVFQPGGTVLADDVAFAEALLGEDAWPADLTSSELAAFDPRVVPVAVSFPLWSEERGSRDWLPDQPLPDHILAFNDNRLADALAIYYEGFDDRAVSIIVNGGLNASVASTNPDAPCAGPAFDFEACFETRRWLASFLGQHLLRTGEPLADPILDEVWWEVGKIAQESSAAGTPIEHADENWAGWMYLQWTFSPERHGGSYLTSGLDGLGLSRHATFVALRGQVARAVGTSHPYGDLENVVGVAPDHWLIEAMTDAYEQLIARLESGDVPAGVELDLAHEKLDATLDVLRGRLTSDDRPLVEDLHGQVLDLLPAATSGGE